MGYKAHYDMFLILWERHSNGFWSSMAIDCEFHAHRLADSIAAGEEFQELEVYTDVYNHEIEDCWGLYEKTRVWDNGVSGVEKQHETIISPEEMIRILRNYK